LVGSFVSGVSFCGGDMEEVIKRINLCCSGQKSFLSTPSITPLPNAVVMENSVVVTDAESDGFTCPICLDENIEATNITQLRCAHELCSTCYQQLQERMIITCPLCRRALPFVEKEITDLMYKDKHRKNVKRLVYSACIGGGFWGWCQVNPALGSLLLCVGYFNFSTLSKRQAGYFLDGNERDRLRRLQQALSPRDGLV